jgi:ankyrin repeat protein
LTDKNQQTPLHLAVARRWNEAIIKLLLEKVDDPNVPDNSGRTPLHLGAEKGWQGNVRELLANTKINPNVPDNSGRTPLHLVAEKGWQGNVRELLANTKINPNVQDNDGRAPLHLAALGGEKEAVRELLSNTKINPNVQDNDGRAPIHLAALGGEKEAVRELLSNTKSNPNVPDNSGRTPLHLAVENGWEEGVKELLANTKINPNMQNDSEQTPLHMAVENGWEEGVKELLANTKINPNMQNDSGQTPLHMAVAEGNKKIAILLAKKMPVFDVDELLKIAKTADMKEFLQLQKFKKGKPKPKRKKEGGEDFESLFGSYFGSFSRESLEALLTFIKQASPSELDRARVLHKAVTVDNLGIAESILERGANIDGRDKYGKTPLHIAAEGGYEHAVSFLIFRNASTNATDDNGDRPVDLASGDNIKKLFEKKDAFAFFKRHGWTIGLGVTLVAASGGFAYWMYRKIKNWLKKRKIETLVKRLKQARDEAESPEVYHSLKKEILRGVDPAITKQVKQHVEQQEVGGVPA